MSREMVRSRANNFGDVSRDPVRCARRIDRPAVEVDKYQCVERSAENSHLLPPARSGFQLVTAIAPLGDKAFEALRSHGMDEIFRARIQHTGKQ